MQRARRCPSSKPAASLRSRSRAIGLLTATGLLTTTGLACSGSGPSPADHLLLVTIDTLRADHLSVYGGPVETPAFERLAAEGALVEYAVTPIPSTGPAHASLLTGRYPWNHGVLANAMVLGPDRATLPERLHDEDIETAAFVSSYVLHERFGFGRGFDTYEFIASEPLHFEGAKYERFYARGEQTVSRALSWLDEREDERRFFLWIHLFDPHSPYSPPDAFLGPAPERISLDGLSTPNGVNPAKWRQELSNYRGEVRYVDAQLARLIAGLEQRQLLERTAVVVTADHGEGLGEHGRFGHGAFLYEEQIRIPLLVRAPGVPAGRRLPGPAQLEDLHPTILSLLGLPQGETVDGVDLTDWLRGEQPEAPRHAALGRRRSFKGRRDFYFQARPDEKWVGELQSPGIRFDLLGDPDESEGTSAPIPEELQSRVAAASPSPGLDVESLDPEARAALEALGYLAEEERAAAAQ